MTATYIGPYRWIGLILGLVMLGGCASSTAKGDLAGAQISHAGTPEQCLGFAGLANSVEEDARNYRIQPNDDLTINFYLNDEFNQEVTVRPDGKISLRPVGDIQAAGLTPGQLALSLNNAYSNELRVPGATVVVKASPSRKVYVDGQVAHPGAIPLEPRMTTAQAIAQAGGLTPDANTDEAILIRRDACGNAHTTRFSPQQLAHGEDPALLPADVIVVPRSTIADIDLWMAHYVKNLIPMYPYLALPVP